MSDRKSSGGGMGLPEVLTLIFVVLKLFGLIDWNWIAVLSPVLVVLAIWLLLMFLAKISERW